MLENLFSTLFENGYLNDALSFAWALAPIWIPLGIFSIFIRYWLTYKRTVWIKDQGYVLLEIRLPKEVTKSPLAMELVINTCFQPLVGTYLDAYLKGRVRAWFSLELVSTGGQVKFLIWSFKGLKNIIESQIYSQYPNAEIVEAHDYALDIEYDPEKISMFGAQMKLSKADAYPIKTYIDYGLDKNQKEEEKIDPITPVLEFLGSLKPGEHGWIQILIQAHRSEGLKDGRLFKKPDWKESAKKEIKKIIEKEGYAKPDEGKTPSLMGMSEVQKQTISAIERSVSKTPFDTKIRMVYLAQKEIYNGTNIGGLIGSYRQFSSNTLNGFSLEWHTGIAYPWEDFRGVVKRGKERSLLDAYKRRSFFNTPYKNFAGKPFILTSEELATIFHFPGQVAATPTVERIMSKKAEAPTNLPV